MHDQIRQLAKPLRRGLGTLRRRVRSLLLILGVSRAVTVLATALLVFFVLDYTLRLPLWVRGCLLAATVATTAVVVIRRILWPLARPLSDESLAGRVEAAHPEFEDRLRSSLAFARARPDDPDNEDSPELMRVVVAQTVEQSRTVRFAEIARGAAAGRWAAVAFAAAGVLLLGSVARADLVGTFVKRSILLQDVAWPRRTTLHVVDMEPGVPRTVTRGRETTVVVLAKGSVPDRVDFDYWEVGQPEAKGEHVELTPSAEDRSRFAVTLPVYTSYRFTVRGGDDNRGQIYSIEALTPPGIERIEMDVNYPAYLQRAPETLAGGDQRLPQGSTVKLRVVATMPLRSAFVTMGAAEPTLLVRESERQFTTDLTTEKDIRFSLRLVGPNGEENDPGMDTFVLRVLRDQAPSIRVHTPRARAERLAGGVAFIGFFARDDHRIDGVTFKFKINGGDEKTVREGEAGIEGLRFLTTPDLEPSQRRGMIALDLAKMRRKDGKPLAADDRIEYTLAAVDSAGREQATRAIHQVDIITVEDLGQTLIGRQQELRTAVERAVERLDAAVMGAEAIKDAREQTNVRRAAGRAQARQARLIDDLDSIAKRTQGMLNLYVFNRLGDASAAEQLLPYFERHLLEPDASVGIAYRGALYRSLRSVLEDRQIRVGEIFDKLIRLADLSDRLAVDSGPRAYRALGEISKRPGDDPGPALEAAATEHAVLRDGLAKLSRWMKQWQNFEEFVRRFQSLRDEQEGIVGGLKDLDRED
ncbi:MAG: hypothetical protein OER88_00825 [Planctomycetota bacterium]|nr:hypothetical protein [Planctomycetota bacterium]